MHKCVTNVMLMGKKASFRSNDIVSCDAAFYVVAVAVIVIAAI